MTDKTRIAILTLYFGPLPWYFKFFIHSCIHNSTIDFYIITDQTTDYDNISPNVFIIRKALIDIQNHIKIKLNINVSFKNAYKLCDFKPAYGLIFSEYIQGYDFWGMSDIDLIFGNIENFVTKEILGKYDIISVRSEYITGFFSLYRNCDSVNSLFKKSKSCNLVFQSDRYCGFDECSLLCDALLSGANLNALHSDIESMTHLVKQKSNEEIRTLFDLYVVEGTPGGIEWKKGRLIYRNEFEILLYHLVSFKVHHALQIPDWDQVPHIFSINEFSFSK